MSDPTPPLCEHHATVTALMPIDHDHTREQIAACMARQCPACIKETK